MDDAQRNEVTRLGLIELDEDELDTVTAGASAFAPGELKPQTLKWNAPEVKIDLTSYKF